MVFLQPKLTEPRGFVLPFAFVVDFAILFSLPVNLSLSRALSFDRATFVIDERERESFKSVPGHGKIKWKLNSIAVYLNTNNSIWKICETRVIIIWGCRHYLS